MDSDGKFFYRDVEYGQGDKNPTGDNDTSVEKKKQRVLKNVIINLLFY